MSKKNKNKHSGTKDLLVVLFVFAVIILVAVGTTTCGRDKIEIGGEKEAATYEEHEKDNSRKIVVMTLTSVAVVIVICYVVKKSKDMERRREAMRIHNQRLEEQRRLEEAKERIRQARLQEMIDAGVEQLAEKRGRRNIASRGGTVSKSLWDEDFDTADINDKRLDEYYRNKYEDDDMLDDLLYDDMYDEEEYDDEPQTFLEKVIETLQSIDTYWWIVIGVFLLAIVGGVIIALFVL